MRFPASSRHFTGVLIYPTECELSGVFLLRLSYFKTSGAGAFLLLKKALKRISKIFLRRGLRFDPLFVLLRGVRQKRPTSSLKTEYTFIRSFLSGGETLSRMKVRHDPPAQKGNDGKQGGRANPNYSEISDCYG